MVIIEPAVHCPYLPSKRDLILERYGLILTHHYGLLGEPGVQRWRGAETWVTNAHDEKEFGISGLISPRGLAEPVAEENGCRASGYRLRADILHRQYDIHIPSEVINYTGSWIGHACEYPIRRKERSLRHMFHFAVENSIEPWYFTEKLVDCLCTHTVPLYYGDPDIGQVFDLDGIIQIDGENWLEVVNSLTPADYYDRKAAVERNFERAQTYRTFFDCVLTTIPFLTRPG